MATSEDVCNEVIKNSPENCVVKHEATENKGNEPSDLRQILEFLQKNNYKETLELFKKEAKLTENDQGPEVKVENGCCENSNSLVSYTSDSDPSIYDDAYLSLRTFIETSSDMHRCELSCILYPVFVHMYLELVFNGHEKKAKEFFERFRSSQEEYYQQDIQNLSFVTKVEHIAHSPILEEYRGNKFTIRMLRDSYNRLKRFIKEKSLNSLMSIVEEHLIVDVFDGAPRSKQQLDGAGGAMFGDVAKEVNKGKIFYGLLKEPDISVQLDEDDEEPMQNEDGKSSKKRKPKRDPLLMKKSKNDPNAPPLNRIPLPELKDIDKVEKARAYREAAKRVNLGPDNLPSICFHTILNSHQGVSSVEISEDSSMLASGFADSEIRVWSLTRNKLRSIKPPNELELIDKECDDVAERIMDDRTACDSIRLHGHCGPVYSTAFSQDRNHLISGSEDGTVRLWSLQTWTNTVAYKGHLFPVWDVSFCAHGRYFASASNDRTARLWATDHIQPLRIFSGHLADVDSVCFHPNSNYVVTGSTDRTVRLWDIHNGSCVRIMTGHKGSVHSLTFSPDGKYLASAGSDKEIILWDISNGEMIANLKGHRDTVYSLAFSREGSILASGGRDNCVKLWNVNKIFADQDSEMGYSGSLITDSKQYEIGSYPTKQTIVLSVHFTRRNLLYASGPFVRADQ